ncbi:MAG: hypothetical protein WA924_13515 [Burkholderiaceae bacterium]
MRRPIAAVLLALAGAGMFTSTAMAETAAAVAIPAVAAPSVPERLFAAAPVFGGTLGEEKIQARLRQKDDMREGVEGGYFFFGQSQKILLAGEFDADGAVFLEESRDGTTVSGQWDGKLDGDTFSGTWSSFDGSINKPFALKVIPQKTAPQADGGRGR